MTLGYYTIATQALFLGAKLLGLADNVGWGFILAPAFFHAGGFTVLYLQYRHQKKFQAEFEAAMADVIVEIEKEMNINDNDDTIH